VSGKCSASTIWIFRVRSMETYLKTEIRRFQSRHQWNCKLLSPKISRPTSNDYSDPAKQNARLGRVDIIELRKCLLLSMLATFPSSPSHGHRFRRRRRRGHDDRWLTAICFDRVNDSWPQRHDITTRSWGPTSYDWFCQLNSRRTSKNWIAQIILRLQSSDWI